MIAYRPWVVAILERWKKRRQTVRRAPRLAAVAMCSLALAASAVNCEFLENFDGLTGARPAATDAGGTLEAGDAGDAGDASPPPDPYYTAVMSDSPIAYFRLSDSAGPSAKNEVMGSNITALYPTNNVSYGAPGALSDSTQSGVRFTDVNAQLSVIGPLDFPGDVPFTFEVWLNLDSVAVPPTVGADMLGSAGNLTGWNFFVTTATSQTEPSQFRTEMWNGGTIYLYTQHHDAVVASHYYHLIFEHSDVDHMDHLVVDGQSSEDGVANPGGMRADNGTTETWGGFLGVLDELAIYDKALSEDRIAAHLLARCQAPATPCPP